MKAEKDLNTRMLLTTKVATTPLPLPRSTYYRTLAHSIFLLRKIQPITLPWTDQTIHVSSESVTNLQMTTTPG